MIPTRWSWPALFILVFSSGCGGNIQGEVGATVATLMPIRGAVVLGEEPSPSVARAGAGQEVSVPPGGLARLILDDGPAVLLGPGATLQLTGTGSFELRGGRVFTDVVAGDSLELQTEYGRLRIEDAAASIEASDTEVRVYVVRGEVSYAGGEERGAASAGHELSLTDDAAETEPTALWTDWTGGLARPGPLGEAPRGMGTLVAREPSESGVARWPLVIRRLDVRVRLEGDMAITEVDQVFFNPASEVVEGLYRFRAPEAAVLHRFAVDRNGSLVDGYVKERAQARQAYQQQVYQGSTLDPALLEWVGPGSYRARIYPIGAGETRRIVVRYAEWLSRPQADSPRIYRYPMGGGADAPHVQEMSFQADLSDAGEIEIRAGHGAQVEGGLVTLRESDFQPRADLWLELDDGGETETARAWRADHQPPLRAPGAPPVTNEADERDYWYLPLRLSERYFESTDSPPAGMDLVVVADVSAGTDDSHLELGRSVVEALAAHLGSDDRVALVASDLTLRPLGSGEAPTLGPATTERMEGLLDALARAPAGGATDLGAVIAGAADLLDPERPGMVIYVGDGAPTVGELGAEELLERVTSLPERPRLYAVGVGSGANLDLLEVLTRGGGLAIRVEERAAAAHAALRILAHASRPLVQGVEVETGPDVDAVFPRNPADVVLGDVLSIVGRIGGTLPTSVTVRGTMHGEAFEVEVPVQTDSVDDGGDLRLRWAGERLRQLLLNGAGREEVADLGIRYGLITPYTSFYVPSAQELSRWSPRTRARLQGDALALGETGGRNSVVRRFAHVRNLSAAASLWAPLALGGCGSLGDAAPAAESEVPEWEEDEDSAGSASESSNPNRYAIGGPDERAEMLREQAAAEAEPMPAAAPPPAERRHARPRSANQAPSGLAPGRSGSPGSPHGGDEGQMGRRQAPAEPASEAAATRGAPERDSLDDHLDQALEPRGEPNDGSGGLGASGSGRGGGGTGQGTIGLGIIGTAGSGSGQGYGRGAGGLGSRAARVPRVRSGSVQVQGSLAPEVVRRIVRRHINEIRFCYEQQLASNPSLEGRVNVAFTVGASGQVGQSAIGDSTLGNVAAEGCIVRSVRRWRFPQPQGGGIVRVIYPFTFSVQTDGSGSQHAQVRTRVRVGPRHLPQHCSDAARLSLSRRGALWRERLQRVNNVSSWVQVYRDAQTRCEAPSWRGRRTLLRLILRRAGSMPRMVNVYRAFSQPSARAYLRVAMRMRVRTPDDLRRLRQALGVSERIDWPAIETVLERTQSPTAKVRIIREFIEEFPRSLELKLKLLELLEHAEKLPEARRLAAALRADPMADAGVRTAIGEMYLRLDDEPEARRVFSEIVEFAPSDEVARRRLGDLYRAHGWFEDAYRQYETLAGIRPDDPGVLLLLAQAAAGVGRLDEALRLEQRLAETAEPGSAAGLARTAILWSSVRYALLRRAARAEEDSDAMRALLARMRRGGVLGEAGAFRASLVWSHPDAGLSLWASHPGLGLTRPTEIAPEHGIEAFDLEEQEPGPYRLEVRRAGEDHLGAMEAQLVILWNEGQEDEKIEVIPLRFEAGQRAYAWTIQGREIEEAPPSADAMRGNQ